MNLRIPPTTLQILFTRSLTALCAVAFLGAHAHAATVTIDCAVDQGPANHVANGYLTSICPTQPANSLIAPLKPTTFRSDYNSLRGVYTNYDRLYSLGTRDFQVTLAYNYDIPYQMREIGYGVSWSTWTDFVNQAVDSFVSSGKVVSYDIFNEPDLGGFRTEEDMYTLWRTTFNLIRARDPSAKIVGPSVAYPVNLRPFLLRAKAEGVFPDIVAFHQYGDPAAARPYMSDLRAWLVANGMGTPPISVNEIIGDGVFLNAGYVAGTLSAYDRAGVVSAHKACWEDPNNPQPNTPPYTYHCCNNFVLDGLLNVDTVGTRAGWWVYKAYADVSGRLVNLYTSTDRIDGIAGLDATAGGAAALIGKYGDDGGGVTTLVVKNLSSAPYLIQQDGSVHITALRIPNTGAATLSGLITEVNISAPVVNSSIQVALPNFGFQDAYQVLLGASAIGPAPTPTPTPTPGTQTPYRGAIAIPGTVKTSEYDNGGESYAYHDSDTANQLSSTYRVGEGVDSDGTSIGWVVATEWMEYTVNVGTAGTYSISIPLSHPGTGGSMHISMNGVNVTGAFAFPNTGGWGTYQNVVKSVTLSAGTQIMRVSIDANGSTGYGPGIGDLITVTGGSGPVNQPPLVSITAPANNATFMASTNITLSAGASDNDGTISKVDFYRGTTLLGTATTSPYSYVWANVPAGNYSLTANATDNGGAVTVSAVVNITVNPSASQTPYGGTPFAVPGTVKTSNYDNGGDGVAYHDLETANQLSSTFRPGEGVDSNGSSVGWISAGEWLEYTVNVSTAGAYTISIPMSHPGTGGSMHVSMNGVNVTGAFAYPTTADWGTYQNVVKSVTLSAGTQVMLVSFDANGSTGYGPGLGDLISISAVGVNQPPVVNLTAPANNATFVTPTNITLTATASDSDGTVSKVEFFQGATLLGSDTSSPYSFAWNNVAAGSYALTAKATDNGGAQTASTAVNITVTNTPPVVSLTAPANNATFVAPANITLSATASDSNGTISKVEFFQGATLLGSDTSSPYSFTWNNVAVGSYALTAKATDNLGAQTVSATVNITVITPPPSTPYSGNPIAIPGNLKTSLYDKGGEGVAYHDLEAANTLSSTFRPGEGVDANANVGIQSIKAGEWVKYTVNVPSAGSYALSVPVSSQGNGGTLHISFGGVNKTGTLTVPNTNSWSKTKNLTATVNLSAGVQVMQIFFDTNGSSGFTCRMSDNMLFTPVGTG